MIVLTCWRFTECNLLFIGESVITPLEELGFKFRCRFEGEKLVILLRAF